MAWYRPNLSSYRELLFQVILHGLVFVLFSFNKDQPRIEPYQIVYFLNYAFAALIINYLLLPHFFYSKKYLTFFFLVALVLTGVILVEELILEKIYFPASRGTGFPGVHYSLLEVLPPITILSGAKFAWDALGKQREVDELRATIKESELQFLKSQINPHFLFNNLNNLYSYALVNSPKTPTIILELSSVLRYMLYECREKFVPLPKEVEQLRNFTQLNELHIEERGKVNFTTHTIQANYVIAPLILIVFIENAFKHSQASQSDNICIDIQIRLSDQGELDFLCRNSFRPMANTESLTQGIGLENVKKRLQLLYPNAHQLTIRATEHHYEVHLLMQLKNTHSL